MKTCPTCLIEAADTAKFCGSCGQTIPDPEPNKCKTCGSDLSETAKFCAACGATVVKSQSTRIEQPISATKAEHPSSIGATSAEPKTFSNLTSIRSRLVWIAILSSLHIIIFLVGVAYEIGKSTEATSQPLSDNSWMSIYHLEFLYAIFLPLAFIVPIISIIALGKRWFDQANYKYKRAFLLNSICTVHGILGVIITAISTDMSKLNWAGLGQAISSTIQIIFSGSTLSARLTNGVFSLTMIGVLILSWMNLEELER